jgi:hypothetical protein
MPHAAKIARGARAQFFVAIPVLDVKMSPELDAGCVPACALILGRRIRIHGGFLSEKVIEYPRSKHSLMR